MAVGWYSRDIYTAPTLNKNDSCLREKSPQMGDCVMALNAPLSKCKVEKLPGPSE